VLRPVDQVLGHCVRHRAGLRVIHLHGDGALSRSDILPQLRISAAPVQQDLDIVAGIDVRPGEKLDAARKERILDGGRAVLVALRNYAADRRVVSDGKDADQRQYQSKQQQGDDCYVLDQ